MYRWWSAETIAIVTGGNRGIGFEITRQLAGHGLTVILTSRDSAVGLEAAKVLQEGGLNVASHQLDVLDPSSIKDFADWLQQNYGGLDILVNCCYHYFYIDSYLLLFLGFLQQLYIFILNFLFNSIFNIYLKRIKFATFSP